MDVIEGTEDVPYWQIATTMRLINNFEMIYDPQGFINSIFNQLHDLKWAPSVIELKRSTAKLLQQRTLKALEEDMLADAYIWAIKGVEEAMCVPLMVENYFFLETPTLLLDSLQKTPKLKKFYIDLLGAYQFRTFELDKALKELEEVATYIYHKQPKRSNREMWILSGFVSINTSERLLRECYSMLGKNQEDASLLNRYFESAVAEYWQALFLCAQTPKSSVSLDSWIVSLFWKWLAREKTEKDISNIVNEIDSISDLQF